MKRTLKYLLLVTFSVAVQSRDLKSGWDQTSKRDGDEDVLGKFHRNKASIAENELKHLETSLDKFDDTTRTKRHANENVYYDEPSEASNEQDRMQETNDEASYEVKNTLQGVQLPPKTGSSTFSIHANKVYILYPSTFQDPNIFGRFSIPQTINLDPNAATMVKQNDELKIDQNIPLPVLGNSYSPISNIRGKRQLQEPSKTGASPKGDERKRNVETHLNGSIVVLNQDVNEFNRKESY